MEVCKSRLTVNGGFFSLGKSSITGGFSSKPGLSFGGPTLGSCHSNDENYRERSISGFQLDFQTDPFDTVSPRVVSPDQVRQVLVVTAIYLL